ncbi:MAG: M15 family metallopeptidase [Lachnospiraceae bacterium]|nr:M15 family metallopeptidase [Lachnospiraceae bacterium]
MRYDSPQMEPTFREELLDSRKRFSAQHKILRVFAWPVFSLLLLGERIAAYFRYHAMKLSGVVLVAAAFAVSSSFSFPVLSMRAGFVSLDADREALKTAVYSNEVMAAEQTDAPDEAGTEAAPVRTPAADTQVGESLAEFALSETDPAELDDPTLLEEEYRYHSESGSDIAIADAVSLEELLAENDKAWAAMDEGDADEEGGFDPMDWRLILVNKQHPIPEDYTFELTYFNEAMQCDSRISGNLLEMFRAAREEGISLIPCSPYRTHEHQVELFNRKINKFMNAGLSYMDAYTMAAQAVTVPGTSEHEIGLAIDIVTNGYSILNEGFGETPAGQWLKAHSAEYGFIIRYPKEKESITGIEFEPWHFRYVGRDAASLITEEGICLEEFWDKYLYR